MNENVKNTDAIVLAKPLLVRLKWRVRSKWVDFESRTARTIVSDNESDEWMDFSDQEFDCGCKTVDSIVTVER